LYWKVSKFDIPGNQNDKNRTKIYQYNLGWFGVASVLIFINLRIRSISIYKFG